MWSQEYNLVQNIMFCCMSTNYLINSLRKHIYISNNIAIRIFFYILLLFSLFNLSYCPFMHRTHIIISQKSATIESQTERESEILRLCRSLSFMTWASDLSKILIFSSLILSFLPTWEDRYGKTKWHNVRILKWRKQ